MAIRGNPKGTNRGGGWRPGQKSKKVLAREEAARKAASIQAAKDAVEGHVQQAEAAGRPTLKMPKEVLRDAMVYFFSLAATYQPSPGNAQADEKKFEKYMDKAGDFAAKLAPYEHQRMPQAHQHTALPVDLSKLSTEELIVWDRLFDKASLSGGDTGGNRPALTSH